MPYYRLTSPDKGENILFRKASHSEVLHTSGVPIDPGIAVPFRFLMDVGEPGYPEIPDDLAELDNFDAESEDVPIEDRLLDYYSNVCVMSPRLLEALQVHGVDNLQSFPAHIENSETGEVLAEPYLFVNVIGIVSCADLGASDTTPLGSSYYFHKLILDPSRVGCLLLFRLKEAPFEIIIHERIARVIEAGAFAGVGVEKVA